MYGPGHNRFTVGEQDEVLLVYHARTCTEIVGDPLWNPDRHSYVKPLGRAGRARVRQAIARLNQSPRMPVQASISQAPFGLLPDGRPATLHTLRNRNGLVVKITDLGGIITELHAPDRAGNFADIVLGFTDVAPYAGECPYFGALIGRYGNRIRDGKFVLDSQTHQLSVNNGPNHLHGGELGFHKVLWRAIPFHEGESVGLTMLYRSVDGEQGYPGNLDVTVVYELNGENELVVAYAAVTDRATPVNLTQHSYLNLAGGGTILSHQLTVPADAIAPVEGALIPTGALASVAGMPFDFRTPQAIGARIDADDAQLRHGGGYDHHFVLNRVAGEAMSLAARVFEPASGRVLELFTEEPGLQFYSGNFLDGSLSGKGQTYACRSGICLEPQHFPDSPKQPQFPNTILRPGETYATVSRYRFSTESTCSN